VHLIDLVDYPRLQPADLPEDDIVDRVSAGDALPDGQYAFAFVRNGAIYLARDPIGSNKLFFGYDREMRLVAGNRIREVWRCGVPLAGISSCPPGHVVEVSRDGIRDLGGSDLSGRRADLDLDCAAFAEGSRAMLERAFTWLAEKYPGWRFVVCLSGGLDSSVVASFAVEHLPAVTGVSFTYLADDDLRHYANGTPPDMLASVSDDYRCAAEVASALGIPLLPAIRSRHAVAAAVAPSVRLCQDWHDFNVHCATVNLFIAQDVRAAFSGDKVMVLTGDLMNELVCDYSEEQVGDTIYYKIPKVPLDKCRRFFVRGLDTSDREIGVFWAYGLAVWQPFAVLADRYMRVPAPMLATRELKWILNGPLLAPPAAAHVNRAKTRAQVGGKDLGTLGIYHRLGVTEERLRDVWRAQFPGEQPVTCDQFIQFGRYRTPRMRETDH
jgi:asparagine synthetase B (glutamine-hydrolysing)